jgi:tight adherence protein B
VTANHLVVACLAATAAGGVAYVFIEPLLSGESRARKRQQALVGAGGPRRADRIVAVSRRDQVAQTLKDLDARAKARSRATIEQRLARAGLGWTKRRYLVVSVVVGLVLGLAMLALTGSTLTAGTALFAGALGIPRWILAFLSRRRMNRFVEELPNAMDIIVRGIRSGLPVGDCLRIIASEARDPVKSEFRTIVEEQSLGLALPEAVSKLHERMPTPEASFFAIVIAIQQKAGGNLSEALNNLSRVLRERRKMKSKIVAMSMEAKASAVIIAALPFLVAFMTWISSPQYIELLWTTGVGKMALFASACWMAMGIAVMKKMINFDI